MWEMLKNIMPKLESPTNPIHLLGIADPGNIEMGIGLGIDTFDSCYPLRVGRTGHVFTE